MAGMSAGEFAPECEECPPSAGEDGVRPVREFIDADWLSEFPPRLAMPRTGCAVIGLPFPRAASVLLPVLGDGVLSPSGCAPSLGELAAGDAADFLLWKDARPGEPMAKAAVG